MLEKVLGLGVDLELTALGLGVVESRDLGDVLILALTLLFLELEGDTTDGSTLNTLHQVGGVAGNLRISQVSNTVLSVIFARRESLLAVVSKLYFSGRGKKLDGLC